MKKKVGFVAFLSLFLAACLTLSVGILIAGPSKAGANERLSELPQPVTEEENWNREYLSQLMDWFNDRFFLRQELISFDRLLTGMFFGTSEEDSVILGDSGWLYFTDTLADYTGIEPMSDREIWSAAKNLALMAEYCRENGKEFAFVIAPNKNSLYDEAMPDFGVKAQNSDADRLMAQLAEWDVTTVDLFSAFEAEKETLYFAHDSHWNSKGAALGADLINDAFDVASDYFGGEFVAGQRHDGDLYAMMYPALKDPERDFSYEGKLEFSFSGNATRPDALVLNTQSDASGSLLVYRDSFGNLLFPYLADSYGVARFSRSTTYDLTPEAEYVLVELVERNLDYLIANQPVMASPVRKIDLPGKIAGNITGEVSKKGGFTRVTGKLTGLDEESAIYVACGDTVYEAFCFADGGFGVNLPLNQAAEYVICTQNGAVMAYKLEK